ncbi:TRAP transporter small permease [Anaerotignum sp.]|nr:TRAP transporter small permease [Anaerotignum sp.]MBQ7759224.1 TRAP transporter small permease [Anaerotignum sp.]
MALWKKFDKILTNVQTYVCAVLFMVIIVIGAINVFCRYVLNDSITWAEEAMRFICIWLVFIGSSLTIRIDGHISIDILQSILKNTKVKFVLYVITRIVAASFLVVLLPASIQLVQNMSNSYSSAVGISYSVVYLSFPIGAVSMLLSFLSAVPKHAKEIKDGGEAK